MRILNASLISAPISLATSQNLQAVWIGHAAIYAIQLVFTGSPNGTLKLQASTDVGGPVNANDNIRFSGDVTNWTDIANSGQAISAAGNHMWTVQNPGYQWVRVVYTANSGSGSLTIARVTTKGV